MPASEFDVATAFVVAAALCLILTPVVARAANELGILDRPGGYKEHEHPTAYLGGIAVLVGVVVALLVTAGTGEPVPAIVAGAVVVCGLGTLDDIRPIPPLPRLVIQTAVAAWIWEAGIGWNTQLPEFADFLLSLVWVVAITNVLNLMDNLDGACASSAAGSAVGIAAVAAIAGGADWGLLIAAATLGACLAFLPYNLAIPSRIFLGDGGSTLIGFLLAVAAMGAVQAESNWSFIAAAVLLLGVPILDAAVAFDSRRRRGLPWLEGGRDHLTHRIYRRLGRAHGVALTVGLGQMLLSLIVVLAIGIKL